MVFNGFWIHKTGSCCLTLNLCSVNTSFLCQNLWVLIMFVSFLNCPFTSDLSEVTSRFDRGAYALQLSALLLWRLSHCTSVKEMVIKPSHLPKIYAAAGGSFSHPLSADLWTLAAVSVLCQSRYLCGWARYEVLSGPLVWSDPHGFHSKSGDATGGTATQRCSETDWFGGSPFLAGIQWLQTLETSALKF